MLNNNHSDENDSNTDVYVTGIGAKLKEKLQFLNLANVVLHFSSPVWPLRQRRTNSTSLF